jgi:hypothetical protein
MDILIKRNEHEKFMEFLIKNQDDKEWQIFLENIKTNTAFLNYTKEYIVSLDKIATLRKFLNKIFSNKTSDMQTQVLAFEIINYLLHSNSLYSKNALVKNLYLIQILKLAVLDNKYEEKITELIKADQNQEDWFLNLLENFSFYEELALLYELKGDFKLALKFYKLSQNKNKIEELNEKIKSEFVDIETTDETQSLS